ncbi:MAG: hypothetical protein R3F30_01450 [Planctomycetota bacterium]
MRIVAVIVLATLATCRSTSGSAGSGTIPVELGARAFNGGDDIVIEEVASDRGDLGPGAVVTVRGRYRLGSRERATLYFGTTVTTDVRAPDSPDEQEVVGEGDGTFELTHRVPGPGYLHLTYYDLGSGRPFGGVYFGRGDGVLREMTWSYTR